MYQLNFGTKKCFHIFSVVIFVLPVFAVNGNRLLLVHYICFLLNCALFKGELNCFLYFLDIVSQCYSTRQCVCLLYYDQPK